MHIPNYIHIYKPEFTYAYKVQKLYFSVMTSGSENTATELPI